MLKLMWGMILALYCLMINIANAQNIYTEDQQNITVTAHKPIFQLKLKSNPTTGYSWALRDYNPVLISKVKQQYMPAKSMLMGAGGVEWWTFRVTPAGLTSKESITIRMIYARPWEKNEGVKQVVFKIKVE